MEKNRMAEIQKQIGELREEEWEIEKAERIRRNTPLVGVCFKYHNSYGGDDKKWWFYARILRLEENGSPVGWCFEIASDGKIRIEPAQECSHIYPGNGYRPIPTAEFRRAWRATLAAIEKIGRE